ncbi:MAG: hypothetical protein U9Q70_13120 [Chloroflexota bacterium]|nr:hypothetical protein [Chloroflexota bacterium]
MEIGLLWYGKKKGLSSQLPKAAQRYRQRFGEIPNVCYVNPQTLPAGECQMDGILLRPSTSVLQDHLWIGREERE